MDVFETAFLDFWRCLNNEGVRYIVIGEIATGLYGYPNYTGLVELYIDDTLENRRKLKEAYRKCGLGDDMLFEKIVFKPGLVLFPITNGIMLDITTSLEGVNASFEKCLQIAPEFEIEGIKIPVLHINHLLSNKKAVNRPKDQLDVMNLEKVKSLLEEKEKEQ